MEGTNNVAAALIIEEGQTKGSQNQESGATSAHTVGHGLYYCSFLYSFGSYIDFFKKCFGSRKILNFFSDRGA